MWKIIKTLLHRIFSMQYLPRYARLAGELSCYKAQFAFRKTEAASANKPWAVQADKLIAETEHYLRDYKIDEAWKSFHAAKRFEINGMSDSERAGRAKALRSEVVKLNEWRKDAILELIGKPDAPPQTVPVEDLIRAIELKDDYYNNEYYKNRLMRSLFRLLFALMVLDIGVIILYFAVIPEFPCQDFGTNLSTTGYLLGVLLFGFLGAITSCIIFTRSLSGLSRESEIISSRVLTLSKIFVGAGFSIFIFLILRSSVAGSIKLFAFSIKTPLDFFAIAFVSGFTERLAQRAIDLLAGKGEETKKP
jgi:hypothetical protein